MRLGFLRTSFLLAAAASIACLPALKARSEEAGPAEVRIAVLRGLDKITARVSRFEAPIGRPTKFGTLSILVRTCSKRPPEEPPEVSAFLEIDEVKPGEEPVRYFSGWMFASSPALSALEHPVFDVSVIDCRISAPATSSPKE